MELKESDFKLLAHLYHNNREPISKIAKACKLTRDQVEYKLNKYVSSKLIIKFFPVINYLALGYNCLAIILIKTSKEYEIGSLLKNIQRDKNIISYGKAFGKYDLYINSIFRDEKELSEYISNLMKEDNISDYTIIKPYFTELYPLKFLNSYYKNDFSIINESEVKIKLDEKEKKILKSLSKNGRAKIIDIAKETKISSELILYKLKHLEKERVILGSRIQFDMEKLGYSFSTLLLNIKSLSDANKEKIKKFAKESKNVNSIILSLNKPNCIIQLFHKNNQEIKDVISNLKDILKNSEIEINLLLINQEEGEINTLPFL
ncbi:hypothetical protein COU56_00070 [Candidatus Pacearchaeota archaeon CG10_big_fil_rev_8_21_14_0_10_31_9]|nr:MAG: hypothetical protein COU56_00070 [Candidatus Pacearchaeota archaeon CG10_big_fil_rev_8_21_14_0_10_31_9]